VGRFNDEFPSLPTMNRLLKSRASADRAAAGDLRDANVEAPTQHDDFRWDDFAVRQGFIDST